MGLVKRYVSSARSFSRDLTLRLLPSYPQLVGVRACLGIAESGLGCGVFYQCVSEPSYPVQLRTKTCSFVSFSLWYPRHMLQTRIALIFGGATFAGAFSGLLAFGISFMSGTGGLLGWSWIFVRYCNPVI